MQPVALRRKGARQGFHEGFGAVGPRKFVAPQGDHVVGRGVEAFEGEFVEFEAVEQAAEGLSGVGTAHKMHAGLELRTGTHETLQTTARLRALFEHGDGETVARQQRAAGESAQSATDDQTMLHTFLQNIGAPVAPCPTNRRSTGAFPVRCGRRFPQ